MAWSRKALNLISALHSTSGLGVRPAWYSRRNSAKTRSLYSEAKFTCSISMPTTSATAAASTKSTLDDHYSLSSSPSHFFLKNWEDNHDSQYCSSHFDFVDADRKSTR